MVFVLIHGACCTYMIVYIHAPKEKRTNLEPSGKKGTFCGIQKSHMGIDSEEQEAPKDEGTDPSSPFVHPSDYQEDSVETTKLVDLPRDVSMTGKRPIWLHETF